MAGILNKKNRIIDYKLTENGRKQIQNGDINFKFYTISDSSIVYNESILSKDHKISNSEDFYLPFEVSTEPFNYVNPEFNLTDELDLRSYNDIQGLSLSDNVETKYVDLNTTNSVTKKIIEKRLLNHRDVLNTTSGFSFKQKEERNTFDFNPNNDTSNNFLESYPTIGNITKNLDELLNLKKDYRFSHKSNYKKLPPINIDGSLISESKEETNINSLNYIFNTLKEKTGISLNESRESAISKAVSSLKNISHNRIFKNFYFLDEKSTLKKYFFEMHEIEEILGEEINVATTTLKKGLDYKLIEASSMSQEELREISIKLGFEESSTSFIDEVFTATGIEYSDLSISPGSFLIVKKASENFKKLAFVDLGTFYNRKEKRSFSVFLIGKVIYNEKAYVKENIEYKEQSNLIKRNISSDYTFINLFTLLLE